MAEKKINGRHFQVGTVLAKDALILQARLMKVIGAGIERLPEILKGVGEKATPEEKAKSNSAAIAAFTDIFAKSDPEEMVNLIQNIVELATVKRGDSSKYEQVDMDLDFSSITGDPGSLYPVALFVIKEVLGDFFTGILDSGSLAKTIKG